MIGPMWRPGWVGLTCLSLAAGLALSVPAQAQSADPAVVELGRQQFRDAGCGGCHGEQGQGGVSPDLPAGPSLRASALDHEAMVGIVSCGLPGTQMPAWLKGAYTEVACYDMELGAPPPRTIVVGVLTSEQAEALVTYIMTELKD